MIRVASDATVSSYSTSSKFSGEPEEPGEPAAFSSPGVLMSTAPVALAALESLTSLLVGADILLEWYVRAVLACRGLLVVSRSGLLLFVVF